MLDSSLWGCRWSRTSSWSVPSSCYVNKWVSRLGQKKSTPGILVPQAPLTSNIMSLKQLYSIGRTWVLLVWAHWYVLDRHGDWLGPSKTYHENLRPAFGCSACQIRVFWLRAMWYIRDSWIVKLSPSNHLLWPLLVDLFIVVPGANWSLLSMLGQHIVEFRTGTSLPAMQFKLLMLTLIVSYIQDKYQKSKALRGESFG